MMNDWLVKFCIRFLPRKIHPWRYKDLLLIKEVGYETSQCTHVPTWPAKDYMRAEHDICVSANGKWLRQSGFLVVFPVWLSSSWQADDTADEGYALPGRSGNDFSDMYTQCTLEQEELVSPTAGSPSVPSRSFDWRGFSSAPGYVCTVALWLSSD